VNSPGNASIIYPSLDRGSLMSRKSESQDTRSAQARAGADSSEVLLHRAAEGDTDAQFRLGLCHLYGRSGHAKDEGTAAEWLRRAAEAGHVDAQFKLGNLFETAVGIATRDERVLHWYRMAADRGHALAQYILWEKYSNGWGVERDLERALDWLHRAAEHGDSISQALLGQLYESGHYGLPTDPDKAAYWYARCTNPRKDA
jgi:TPR repeat protein